MIGDERLESRILELEFLCATAEAEVNLAVLRRERAEARLCELQDLRRRLRVDDRSA